MKYNISGKYDKKKIAKTKTFLKYIFLFKLKK